MVLSQPAPVLLRVPGILVSDWPLRLRAVSPAARRVPRRRHRPLVPGPLGPFPLHGGVVRRGRRSGRRCTPLETLGSGGAVAVGVERTDPVGGGGVGSVGVRHLDVAAGDAAAAARRGLGERRGVRVVLRRVRHRVGVGAGTRVVKVILQTAWSVFSHLGLWEGPEMRTMNLSVLDAFGEQMFFISCCHETRFVDCTFQTERLLWCAT